MKTTVSVVQVAMRPGPTKEALSQQALQRNPPDFLLAQSYLLGTEKVPDPMATVVASGEDCSIQFAVLVSESPRIGDVFEIDISRVPALIPASL